MAESYTSKVFYSLPHRIYKCEFSGYACEISSASHAQEIIADIKKIAGRDGNPFAFRVMEDGKLNEVCNDSNEPFCGDLLLKCIQSLQITNAIVFVSRKVYGCFVTDMIQQAKLVAIRKSAKDALSLLMDARDATKDEEEERKNKRKALKFQIPISSPTDPETSPGDHLIHPVKEVFPTKVIKFDATDFDFTLQKPKKIGRPGHYLDKRPVCKPCSSIENTQYKEIRGWRIETRGSNIRKTLLPD
eukprot:gene945-1830_t